MSVPFGETTGALSKIWPKIAGKTADNGEQYDEDYFMRGVETGKSLYENYRFLPHLTRPMVRSMIDHLGIVPGNTILDFGCSRGYVVRVFRELGYDAWGYDVSEWAVENGDELVKGHLTTDPSLLGRNCFDWVIAKDVLEHVPNVQETISMLQSVARIGIFAVVPLSLFDGQPYVVSSYEDDVTHIHRLCLSSWAAMFMRPGWSVEGRFMVDGIKQNYQGWEWGNGFLVARKV